MLELLERQKTLTSNQWKIIATANLRGHAELLRLLSDWLRAGVHCRRMAPDLRPVGDHPAFVGTRCSSGRILLGLDGRSHWPAQSLYCDVAECPLATGIMAFTPDQGGWIFLSFFQFFVGFGNASLIAVDIPLVQEFVPSYKRGWVSGMTTVLLPAGNVMGALSGAYLAPLIGWRGLFFIGLQQRRWF